MKKLILIGLIVLIVSCKDSFEDTTPEPNESPKIIEFISFNDEQTLKIGEQVPNFTMNPNTDTEKNLRDFRGKVVMLEFAADWCTICKGIAPKIAATSLQIDTSKFAIIKIYDDYYEKEDFLRDANLYEANYYNVWNGIFDGFDLTKLYEINSFPRSLFINEEGILVAERSTSGINDLEEFLKEVSINN